MMLIGVVALVVIGPKDLPHAIYGIGKWVRKARVVAREFQGHFDEMMREAELDDLRKQAMAARHLDFKEIVEKHVDPKGEIREATTLPPMNDVGPTNLAGPVNAGEVAPTTVPAADPPSAEPMISEGPKPAEVPASAPGPGDAKSTEKGA